MNEDPRYDDIREPSDWERRYTLSDYELLRAAADELSRAGDLMSGEALDDEHSAGLWLGRAHWYRLRLELLREERWMNLAVTSFESKPYSKMYPSTGRDITPESRPDHSSRRLGEGQLPGRPVRDNPQA